MSYLCDTAEGSLYLLMGNEAIARGALEAGVSVASAYPGTPSSEIIGQLSRVSGDRNIYVEWSVNEKVAAEVAFAGSLAGLRSLCAMKQNGVNVASDFLLHAALSGTRGGMVLVHCDDPGALSSINEGESRYFSKMMELPLLEPGDFQEAKDMTAWAFELSERLHSLVMIRSVTRLSHSSGIVKTGRLPETARIAEFRHHGSLDDPLCGPVVTMPAPAYHRRLQEKLIMAADIFEGSPFNYYYGPEKPELLIITSSVCGLYAKEAVHLLDAGERVGILKLGTTWPLPRKLIKKHLAAAGSILCVEEVLPFVEENVKVLAADLAPEIGVRRFFGKNDGTVPMVNELNPDIVIDALKKILGIPYMAVSVEYTNIARDLMTDLAPTRDLTFCPGCPHRASFYLIHNALSMDNRNGFLCGDIGCYTLGFLPCGFSTMKTSHSMGSGIGIASGFGKLGQFGMDQPVVTVCGDSTFFHAAMPALANAVHFGSDVLFILLDNSVTAMTGFQPHPGTDLDAAGKKVQPLDAAEICRSMGVTVTFADPFELDRSQQILMDLLERKGTRVLIFRQGCALSPENKGKKKYIMSVDAKTCIGERCGCGRFCARIFRCPGLAWDGERNVAVIDDVLCSGCGVCAGICPAGAIGKREDRL